MKYKSFRALRERAGLSKKRLAQLTGVSEATVWRWEKGVREPRATDIMALCRALRCTENEVLSAFEARA